MKKPVPENKRKSVGNIKGQQYGEIQAVHSSDQSDILNMRTSDLRSDHSNNIEENWRQRKKRVRQCCRIGKYRRPAIADHHENDHRCKNFHFQQRGLISTIKIN